ncbi:hypothetical protein Pmani_031925 [Petrolisthes manimaculis]|uniref:Uncharacterized protein n=1 Tax=Petrolisthes manimaculis TaxID=1843537 RepID=A0AAE1NTP0_9EUCA|nr:hypothetical protein Pmani_031925 [Petrolisthes manimaculis]
MMIGVECRCSIASPQTRYLPSPAQQTIGRQMLSSSSDDLVQGWRCPSRSWFRRGAFNLHFRHTGEKN